MLSSATTLSSSPSPSSSSPPSPSLRGAACSAASAVLLLVLVGMSVTSGVSQQSFELFAPPTDYAAALVAAAAPLRRTLFVDDVFIAAYVSSTVLFVDWLSSRRGGRRSSLLRLVLVFGVASGVLDFVENHHILAMLRASEHGVLPSPGEIDAQMVASSLKWVLGHAAFAMIGVTLDDTTPFMRAFRGALVGVQLPLGVLVFTVTDPRASMLLGWARYGNVLSGFAVVALLMSRGPSPAAVAVGSGEPA